MRDIPPTLVVVAISIQEQMSIKSFKGTQFL